jgi:hypothetical protein
MNILAALVTQFWLELALLCTENNETLPGEEMCRDITKCLRALLPDQKQKRKWKFIAV